MAPDDKVEIPTWVCTLLALKEESIAYLELPKSVHQHSSRYNLFLEYLSHRAVDITEPTTPTSPDCFLAPLKSGKLTPNGREYPGLLSALSIEDKPTPNFIRGPLSKSSRGFRASCDSSDEDDLGNENEPDYAQLSLGYGRSKLKAPDDNTVCVSHAPPTYTRSSVLYFYAASPATIRSLVNSIFEWGFLKRQPIREPRQGKFELYSVDLFYRKAKWIKQGWKKSRNLDTIFLPHGELDEILTDFNSFTAGGTREWYLKHGLPHRRSYLFHGPSGTGKTSTIRALAGELNLAVCLLELGNEDVSNMQFTSALSNIPHGAMLVIKDVDSILFEDRNTTSMTSPLTFSGLLNGLDGLISTDGVLTVMTTNHPEVMDPALVRGGSIDRMFEFKPPKSSEIFTMFKTYYSDATQEEGEGFADAVVAWQEKETISFATLKELFISKRENNARECIDSMEDFFRNYCCKSNPEDSDWMYS